MGKPDLNAVIEHYGSRAQNRRNYMTNCVLHEDRTPSMSVAPEKGVWNCLSCGQAGDSYKIIMLKEGLDFAGASDFAEALRLPTGGGGEQGRTVGGRYAGSRTRRPGRGSSKGQQPYAPRWRRSS